MGLDLGLGLGLGSVLITSVGHREIYGDAGTHKEI